MAYNDGGFKITIKEKTSKEEILNNIAMVLTYLETTHKIEEFSNFNLYFQMYKDDQRQALIDPNDPTNQSGGFSLKPTSEHKTFDLLPDGSKKITYKKDVDFQRIKQTIDNVINNPTPSKYKAISIKKVEAVRKQYQLELAEKRKIEQAKHEKILEEINKLEQEEKELLHSFKKMIASKFHCDIRDLHIYTTSMNFITDPKTILKYLGTIETPKESKIFRVTYKDKLTKKAFLVEIYDLNKTLLNTISL